MIVVALALSPRNLVTRSTSSTLMKDIYCSASLLRYVAPTIECFHFNA